MQDIKNLVTLISNNDMFNNNLKKLRKRFHYIRANVQPNIVQDVIKYHRTEHVHLFKTDIKQAAKTFLIYMVHENHKEQLQSLDKSQYTILHGMLQKENELYKEVYHTFMGYVRYRLKNSLSSMTYHAKDLVPIQFLHDEIFYILKGSQTYVNKILEFTELDVMNIKFNLSHIIFYFYYKDQKIYLALGEPNYFKYDLGNEIYNKMFELLLNNDNLRNALFNIMSSENLDHQYNTQFLMSIVGFFSNERFPQYSFAARGLFHRLMRLRTENSLL